LAGKKQRKGKKTHKRPQRPYRQPNWKDVVFVRRRNMGGDPRYEFRNYLYCTLGEVALARLLTAQGIAFTPDVTISIPPKGSSQKSRAYVPDFIFNGDEYVWTDEDGTEHVIHGIECKGTMRKSDKAKSLYGKRGINVIVVSEAEIDLYTRRGKLPMRPRPKAKT